MVSLFGQNPIRLRLIFTLDFIYQRHHHNNQSHGIYIFYNHHIYRDMQMHCYTTVLTLWMEQLLVFVDLF